MSSAQTAEWETMARMAATTKAFFTMLPPVYIYGEIPVGAIWGADEVEQPGHHPLLG